MRQPKLRAEAAELVAAGVVHIDSLHGTHPELPLPIGEQTLNEIIANTVAGTGSVHVEIVPIESIEPILRTDPDKSIVLPDGIPTPLRQPLFDGIMIEEIRIRLAGTWLTKNTGTDAQRNPENNPE